MGRNKNTFAQHQISRSKQKHQYKITYKTLEEWLWAFFIVNVFFWFIYRDSMAVNLDVRHFAFQASIILALLAICLFYILSNLKRLYPEPSFEHYSPLKKLFYLIAYFAGTLLMLWSFFSLNGPHLYTIWVGEETHQLVNIEKHQRNEAKRCDYFYDSIADNKTTTYRDCLSATEYSLLPEGPTSVDIAVTKSRFGYIPHSLHLNLKFIEYKDIKSLQQ